MDVFGARFQLPTLSFLWRWLPNTLPVRFAALGAKHIRLQAGEACGPMLLGLI